MKNQIQFLILFIVLCFGCLQAQVTQEWVEIYNGPGNAQDIARSLAVDSSGNVYVTGGSDRGGFNYDYATIKYNSSGNQQWIQRYNSGSANSLVVDGSGNVYVTGRSGVYQNYDFATIKYNSSGDSLWVSRYGGGNRKSDEASSIAVDCYGNVYVTGYTGVNGGETLYDFATIKYNSSGVEQWVQIYNATTDLNIGQILSVEVDNSGNIYVSGSCLAENISSLDYVTIKYSSSGILLWVQKYNGPGNNNDIPYSLAVDDSGNVYVTGSSGADYATIKYNSSGVQQWIQRYDGPGNGGVGAYSLAVDNSGNVYVTGGSGGNSGTNIGYATIKYNSSGDSLWVARYIGPGNGSDGASSLTVDKWGNVYVTGQSNGGATSRDYATIKYNSTGVQQWIKEYNGPGNRHDFATSLAVDNSGNVYVTGRSLVGNGNAYNYATIKYSQTEGITAPSNLKAQSVDSSYIKVNWQDNSNNEDSFYIERTQINDTSHWEVIDAVIQNVNQYSDYFVTRNLKYYYRVKAYSGNIFSGYSNTDSAILGGEPALIPAPPSKLIFLKRTPKAISVGWHDNSGNENGFIIFRKSEKDLFFKIIDSVNTDVVTYQEVGVSPILNYYYKVCSFNSSGISDYSNTLVVLKIKNPLWFMKTPQHSDDHILSGNYPNPFNPVTKINYELRKTNYVSLKVYNVLGNEVFVLVNEKQNAGAYSVEWDAINYPSGIYFYRLQAGEIIETKKMMLIK